MSIVETWADRTPTTFAQSSGRTQRWIRRLPALIIGLIALIGVSTMIDMVHDRISSGTTVLYEANLTQARGLQAALVDAETAVRGYVLSGGRAEYLEPYRSADRRLVHESAGLLTGQVKDAVEVPQASGADMAVAGALADLRANWGDAIRLTGEGQRPAAEAALISPHSREQMERLRDAVASYLGQKVEELDARNQHADAQTAVLQAVNLGCVLIAILAMIYAFGSIKRAINTGFTAKKQTEELFAMADMLQSAAGQDDTNEVLRATAASLLSGFSGTLYVFNNSRDRLDLSTRWGSLAEGCSDHIAPNACWALKRGKPHLNRMRDGALRCSHVTAGQGVLEIPMAARGQLYGLLEIIAEGADAATRLEQIQPVATAMGDAMSLALSSIALRERLRNQALRDALTGLYNRRFLEEMLERVCLDAERHKVPVSAIMIDLDHFKQINDKHGHGAGDAILRDVAAAILSCLRGTDVACRYGGEELAILLPDCSLAKATGKAEQIRSQIAGLIGPAGVSVTASLGVSSIPETSNGPSDLLPAADAALYEAKQQGRDRVVAAPTRPSAQKFSLIEPTA